MVLVLCVIHLAQRMYAVTQYSVDVLSILLNRFKLSKGLIMTATIQPSAPLYQVQPQQAPLFQGIATNQWVQQNQQYLTAEIINSITNHAQANNLRMMLFNFYSNNSWNNQEFANHCATIFKLLARRLQMNNQMQAQGIITNTIEECNKAAVASVYTVFENPQYQNLLTPDEWNARQVLAQSYQALQNEANGIQAQQFQQPQYQQPMMGGMQYGVQAQGFPVQRAPVATGGVSGLWSGSNTQPTMMNTTPQDTSGFTGGAWNKTRPNTEVNSNAGSMWNSNAVKQAQAAVLSQAMDISLPTPVVQTNAPMSVPTPVASVPTPAVTVDGWTQVDEKEWVANLDINHYYQLHDKTTTKRVVYRNTEGKYKQEIVKMDYDAHAVTGRLSHAAYEKQRDLINAKRTAPITEEELKKQIITTKELPNVEFAPTEETGIVKFGFEGTSIINTARAVVSTALRKAGKTKEQQAEVMHFKFNQLVIDYVESFENDASLRMMKDTEVLAKADTYGKISDALESLAKVENMSLWNQLNQLLTDEMNVALNDRLGLKQCSITDFSEDIGELAAYLKDTYGDLFYNTFQLRKNFVFDHFFQVVDSELQKQFLVSSKEEAEAMKYGVGVCVPTDVYVLNHSMYELDAQMEVGESGMLSYEHNSRLRSLGEEVLKDTSSAVKLLVTTDGEVYRFVRGMVDQTAVLLKRIS